MNERTGITAFSGKPLTLLGTEVSVGEPAPSFEVLTENMGRVNLDKWKGKWVVITTVPSLDTPVCEVMTKRFQEEAAQLQKDQVQVLTISMDLPFAHKRFCAANGIENVETLSDHLEGSFGHAFGVLIKEMRLLARSIFIIDPTSTVVYAEVLPDITQQPDYDRLIQNLKEMM